MDRIWYGIGFSIIPFIVLFLGYLNVHPEYFRSIPTGFNESSKYPEVSIDWDEQEKKDPPIQFVSSSHKGLNVWTEVKTITSFWDLWNSPKSELEYEWEYKVKNLSDQKRSITVYYQLVDKNDNSLSENSKTGEVEPNETLTLTNTHRIDYSKVSLIEGGSWTISNRVSY